jgi:hypothetical protein
MIDLSRLKKKQQDLEPFRYEIKMPLDRKQLEEFMSSLRNLGLHPKTPYPDRRVNSVYFDTTDFNDYVENISGIGARRKTRVRWYNGDVSKLTLEQKIKNNKASRKENTRLANPAGATPRTKDGIRRILAQNDSPLARTILGSVYPVLEVQYDRQYFVLAPDLRMTIDRHQKFKRLYPSPLDHFVDSPVYSVIEFKYPATRRAEMQALLRDLPHRVFRHSKYVIGMECTRG